jgi:probable phosphoglycerate mutase
MNLDIVLVRHGQSEGNRDGIFTSHGAWGLTELGRRQAEATARALVAERQRPPIAAIYTSDLPRSVETAEPLAAATGVALTRTAALRERTVGDFTGLSFREVQERYPDGWQALLARHADFRPPGGESHRDCRLRVGAFFDELLAGAAREGGADERRVVLYSHGVAINHLLRHVMGIDAGATRFFFQIGNCSLQRLQHRDDGTFRIFAVNDVAHLVNIATDEPPARAPRAPDERG